ncbi:MAG: peptidoglycan-binding domain-containing protein [Bacteroidia bacterium]
MQYLQTLSQLIDEPQEISVLKRRSPAKPYIRSLQMLLYSLGFGAELSWDKFRADGDYGGGTTTAVQAFLKRNGLTGDGESVGADIMKLMLVQQGLLPALRVLKQAVDQNTVATTYDRSKADASVLKGLENLLSAAGMTNADAVLSTEEAKNILSSLTPRFGDGWFTATDMPAEGQRRSETEIQPLGEKTFEVSDNWLKTRFIRVKKKDGSFYPGIATIGNDRAADFISVHRQLLLDMGLSDSAIKVILPVSANEGNLDAINTWDNAFLTFGMLQWTIGVETSAGELPALLQRVKNRFPDTFQEYYGRYGIDIADTNNTSGYLTFNGQKIQTPDQKNMFRDMNWAFRFWKAGLDAKVQLVQIQHALDRINSFLGHKSYRPLDKFFIGDLITSEYGMCLMLDHHVNRPGHLMSFSIGKRDILGQAMRKAELENSDPKTWGTEQEMKLIGAYLPLRFESGMTDGKDRAERIKGFLDRKEISGERHSFKMEEARARGFFDDTEELYPVVNFEEYESRDDSRLDIIFTDPAQNFTESA